MNKKSIYLLELLLSFLIAGLIINSFFHQDKRFEDFDLGAETTSHFAKVAGYSIHASKLDSAAFKEVMDGWANRGKREVLLVLGNSQTHAINQYEEGQEVLPGILSNKFNAIGYDVIAHTIPNGNLQEFYLLFNFWASKLPIKKVIIPVFIDDLREDGLRSVFIDYILKSNFSLEQDYETGKNLNQVLAQYRSKAAYVESDTEAAHATPQEKSESFLNATLDKHFAPWRHRPNVRGEFFAFLYKFRNTVLRISPQTKRPLIPSLKAKNLLALDNLCENAARKKILVDLYIPPIRPDVDPPYIVKEYNDSRSEIAGRANQFSNVSYRDFDNIVPGKYWGTKDPTAYFRKREYDFMHFQYEGHRILADSLYHFLISDK